MKTVVPIQMDSADCFNFFEAKKAVVCPPLIIKEARVSSESAVRLLCKTWWNGKCVNKPPRQRMCTCVSRSQQLALQFCVLVLVGVSGVVSWHSPLPSFLCTGIVGPSLPGGLKSVGFRTRAGAVGTKKFKLHWILPHSLSSQSKS